MQKLGPVYDKDSRSVYALVYIDKRKMALKSQSNLDKILLTLKTELAQAKLYTEQSREDIAMKKLAETQEAFRQIDLIEEEIFLASGKFYKTEECESLKTETENLQVKISSSKSLDITTMCSLIANELKQKTGDAFKYPVILKNICYDRTSYTSDLSGRLARELSNQLIKNKFPLKRWTDDLKHMDYFEITGSYAQLDSTIKVYLTLTGQPLGVDLETATGYISKSWLKANGIQYIPDAILRQEDFRSKMEPLNTDVASDFMVHADPEKPVYYDGDALDLYVKTTHAGYLRIIYFSADQKRNLLVDNYFIGSDLKNRWLDLKKMEIFSLLLGGPAYGEEDLFVAFSEKPHPELNTKTEYLSIKGKDISVRVITDDAAIAVKMTKSGYNPYNSKQSNRQTTFYADWAFPLTVEPEKP